MVILIQVTVQDIHGQKFDVLVQNDAQVLGLKLQIWESRSIPPQNQQLVFAGRQLQDEETLSLAGVQHGSVVFMVQQNEQTQAVAAQQPAVQQPVAFAQAVPQVQPMSVQQPQPQPQPQPQQVIVPPNNNNRETCCCCIPLRAGVLTLLLLALLGHIFHLPSAVRLCFAVPIWGIIAFLFNLTGATIDAFAIYGWGKRNTRMLMVWIWFQIVQLILCVIGTVAVVAFVLVRGVDVHHGHHGHGKQQGGQSMPNSYDSTSTTPVPHRNFSCQEKAIFGVLASLALVLGVVVSLYYIRAVHRYVQQLREEDSNDRQVQVVNGVVYQQV